METACFCASRSSCTTQHLNLPHGVASGTINNLQCPIFAWPLSYLPYKLASFWLSYNTIVQSHTRMKKLCASYYDSSSFSLTIRMLNSRQTCQLTSNFELTFHSLRLTKLEPLVAVVLFSYPLYIASLT